MCFFLFLIIFFIGGDVDCLFRDKSLFLVFCEGLILILGVDVVCFILLKIELSEVMVFI